VCVIVLLKFDRIYAVERSLASKRDVIRRPNESDARCAQMGSVQASRNRSDASKI